MQMSESSEQIVPTGESLAPLAPGTILLDRYTILELVHRSDNENIYRVASAAACPVCHVENEGGARECGFCGSALPPPPLLGLVQQRATDTASDLAPGTFRIADAVYSFFTDAAILRANEIVAPFRIEYAAQSDVGLKRGALNEPNEDSFAAMTLEMRATREDALGLFMIADGVGGAAAGEVASQLAVQTLTQEWVTRIMMPLWRDEALSEESVRTELSAGIHAANARLVEYQKENALQFGTTVTAAVVWNDRAYLVNLGDSRIYLYRSGNLAQLTRDHSFVGMLVEQGMLAPEEIYTHPRRNVILQCLGDPAAQPEIFPVEGALELLAGDQLVLCSDGLWEMVGDADIARIVGAAAQPRDACAELVQAANAAGGADNISVIVLRCIQAPR